MGRRDLPDEVAAICAQNGVQTAGERGTVMHMYRYASSGAQSCCLEMKLAGIMPFP